MICEECGREYNTLVADDGAELCRTCATALGYRVVSARTGEGPIMRWLVYDVPDDEPEYEEDVYDPVCESCGRHTITFNGLCFNCEQSLFESHEERY